MSSSIVQVEPGGTVVLRLRVETSPVEIGRAGMFLLREAIGTFGDTIVDMADVHSWDGLGLSEQGYASDGGASSVAQDDPVYSAGSGPVGEDAWLIEVASSVDFQVGDHVRASGKGDGACHIYEVLAVPDGTHIQVWCPSGAMTIENGDTVEQCEGSGVYSGTLSFLASDHLDAGVVSGQVRVVMTTVAAGDGPVFDSERVLSWTFDVMLLLGQTPYRTG